MGLVRHDHDIPPLRQGLAGLLKFLHRREDDAVGLTSRQQLFQILPALRLLRRLAQEILAPGELAVELVVQVVPVGDNHYCWALQCLLQIMGIEHHGQGLVAALSVPEHAALAVGNGGVLCGFNGFLHCKILVIARQDFKGVGPVHIEADKIPEDVQEPLFLEDALKEGVKLGILGVLIAAVLGFPLHEAVFPGGDCTRLGGGEVAHDTDLVVDK